MKFAANLSTLLTDMPSLSAKWRHLCQRKDFVFDCIEMQNPYELSFDQWDQLFAETRTPQVVLINSIPLWSVRESNSIPTESEFTDEVLTKTLHYAKHLNVRKVHLLLNDIAERTQLSAMESLLLHGAKYFASEGITVLIEPLAIRPAYYLRDYNLALDIIRRLGQPNLKVMLDTFHLQKLHGVSESWLERIAPFVGHVQISQSPKRDMPLNPGPVDHRWALSKIDSFYKDFVGLEYFSKSDESFEWLKEFESL